ncbi:hypothetical protein EZ428_07710 [Pedobacter frigiditerrae]|uniref:Uncharacterized protein n=1 Tax=Pedobacter frigiditerrae TaxID=2530452 RepID=A0A4R0MWK5_9SPHI|nr:hypothetical protein [Pedobacter frigiditerrae]TCC91639.1 hypothetical protein EZ428_07710 [Pedobacter frigiditerrae]
MKKCITFLVLLTSIYCVKGQENKVSQYIFPDFESGIIKFKVGADLEAKLNYNTLREEMLFMKDDTILVMAEVEKIDAIYIKGLKFIPNGNMFYEEIPFKNNSLYVRHTATLIAQAVDTGLGKTENSAQTSISTVKWQFGVYNFILPEYNIKRKDEFYLKKNDKYIHIKGINTLAEFFPNQFKEVKDYINSNNIDLNNKKGFAQVLDKFSK